MKPSANCVICLLGPTASGKTPLAIQIAEQFPCEIVSVDSAMIYREMNIGTAKPDAETLRKAPHRLIDILDPKEFYSAGQFLKDAAREIEDIVAQGKIPLLVGGTMLYFRVLAQGLAILPTRNETLRAELQQRAALEGWESLHAFLGTVDPVAAKRIAVNDAQRIQRALEVYLVTGKNLTTWQMESTHSPLNYQMHYLALMPSLRERLHERIAERFAGMIEKGFVAEVESLYARGDLSLNLPSMRSVGYRQIWEYLSGLLTYTQMYDQAVIATRQLAKRQMTWLRSWPNVTLFDCDAKDSVDRVLRYLLKALPRKGKSLTG